MAKQVQLINDQPEYSVSQISNLIKKNIEDSFSYIRIKGEISGLKVAPSGHAYFSLKDNNAVISVIIWRGNFQNIKIKIEDGLEVVCTGNITTYMGQSKYQLIANSLSHAGIGALMALLEKRKKLFTEEGLFDQKHKKAIPFLPKKIGVVTSITGAVIKDILHRLNDRFPTHTLIWPVLVQGDKAASEVAEAILGFNMMDNKPDLIIVARGGGSIEDLWCFNEENVVRAAFASNIPIISAIGHETDITLLDFVADKRAPTPTAAAEMAVPVRKELLLNVRHTNRRMRIIISSIIEHKSEKIKSFKNALPDFNMILNNKIQRLDDLSIRLLQTRKHFFEYKFSKIQHLKLKLKSPQDIIAHKYSALKLVMNQFNNNIIKLLDYKNTKLKMQSSLIETLSYQNTLKRGFAIIWDKNKIISSKSAATEESLMIEFKDGKLKVKNS